VAPLERVFSEFRRLTAPSGIDGIESDPGIVAKLLIDLVDVRKLLKACGTPTRVEGENRNAAAKIGRGDAMTVNGRLTAAGDWLRASKVEYAGRFGIAANAPIATRRSVVVAIPKLRTRLPGHECRATMPAAEASTPAANRLAGKESR
jgi:hypothetical protein